MKRYKLHDTYSMKIYVLCHYNSLNHMLLSWKLKLYVILFNLLTQQEMKIHYMHIVGI